MIRKEKEQRVQKQDGKAFETYNVEMRTTYLNLKYVFSKQTANQITPTGRLDVFELNPSGDGPSFTARWDGGSRDVGKEERYDLDIDIHGVSDEEKRRFKNGQGGYSGHHAIKVASNTGHAYQVSLRTPDEMISARDAGLSFLDLATTSQNIIRFNALAATKARSIR